MTEAVWSVSTLLQSIKSTLEQNSLLKSFYLKGEISNYTAHHSGHWYFSLKDEGARIACVMFQGYTKDVQFKPKEGDKVLIRASVSVYNLQGSLQLTVFTMQNAGLGDLYQQFERLKKKLFSQGYFEESHKKKLPKYPSQIAIISGKNTAALQDILKTFQQRWPMINLTIYSCLVQGPGAAAQIIDRLKLADSMRYDVIILARGGGSIEDLWAFNDESLADTIYHSYTPIITGIGHETDTSIADMVADVRAATPTAAVQMVVRNYQEVKDELQQLNQYMISLVKSRMRANRVKIDTFKSHPSLSQPELLTQTHRLQLSISGHTLLRQSNFITAYQSQLKEIEQSFRSLKDHKVIVQTNRLNLLNVEFNHTFENFKRLKIQGFKQNISLLNAYSPLSNLERGYTLSYQDSKVIKSLDQINYKQALSIHFIDGILDTMPIQKGEE